MKKYIGKKWCQIDIEQQEELLKISNVWDNVKAGECIVDFYENLSVAGTVINNDTDDEYDRDLVIDDNAILYDATQGTIVENKKFKDLISLKDAAIMFNKEESTLRRNISNGLFKEWEDCIKFGKQWVFDIKALERVYKEKLK